MHIIDKQLDKKTEACVATIGFFDGVHLGHRFLLEQVKEEARKRNLKSAVITFPLHPGKVINPNRHIDHLTLKDEKIELLSETGVDYCFLLNFSKELSMFSAKEFMSEILKKRFNVDTLVIGYDHRFGHNRADGFDQYVAYGKELGIKVLQSEAYTDLEVGETISSSVIRQGIEDGAVGLVNKLLGYSYFVNGTVIHGKELGRTIGFPTANIQVVNGDKMVPKDGVYAVRVAIEGDNEKYWGMLNIGHRPTINNGCNRSIEVNIFDFNKDIYDREIRLSFVQRLRAEVRFESIDKLVEQLHKDEATVRTVMKNLMEQ